ncbi:MAG: glutamate-5-semialdehyde dehydrogenase [Holophagaceae bacterium]|nr:glutamate-5-semialdehyde dehydrogenase [Holophagaceae bacterium]
MPQVLERILAGDPVGTLFAPNPDPAAASHPILADNPVRPLAQAAREASRRLAVTDGPTRNHALLALADVLLRKTHRILAANERDLDAAVSHISNSAYQRLRLDEAKLREMAAGVRAVAALPDPLHRVQLRRALDEGLELTRVSCPLGVLGVVFESRPDALIQISALALKSGNAVLLKGGSEALHSNAALLSAVQEALQAVGLPVAAVQGLEDRASVEALLGLPELVDLVIPRGSNALVKRIQSATRIPVLGHAEGICHMYLDAAADPAMAVALVRDAKLQYPSACNAVETVLVHAAAAPHLLPLLAADLRGRQVELRGCAQCQALVPDLAAATAEDWDTEYGEPILAVKVVRDLDEALEHIRRHGSGHTEAIVTEDAAAAARFLAEVDAAGVYHNASTRFADGFRYGFGAEVGISTGRIHARGPVGLEGLLSHRYLLRGQGQRVADYAGAAARSFLHRDLPIES